MLRSGLLFLLVLAACDSRNAAPTVGAPLPAFDYRDAEAVDPKALERMRATIDWLASGDDSKAPDYLMGPPVLHSGDLAGRDYLHALGRTALVQAAVRLEQENVRGNAPEGLLVYFGESQDPMAAPVLIKLLLDNLRKAGIQTLRSSLSPDLPQRRAIVLLEHAISELGINALPYLAECLKSPDPLVSGIAQELLARSVRIPDQFSGFEWPIATGAPEDRQKLLSWWEKNAWGLGWCPELQRFRHRTWSRPGG